MWKLARQILDSLTAWLGEKRKTEFSWTSASQAMSETKIFAQDYNFLRYCPKNIRKYGFPDIH